MSSPITQVPDEQGALNVSLLLAAIWKARSLGGAIVLCFVLAAIFYIAFLRTPQFRAQAAIGPVASSVGPSGATQAFAAYAGVDVGAGDTGRFSKYLQVLHSNRLAERLEARHHVLKYLVPGWDESAKAWGPPPGIVPATSRFVKGLLGYPAWTPPDANTLSKILEKSLRVERVAGATILDTKNQISTVSLQLRDRQLAITMLGEILDEADSIVREDQLLNTTDRINYLSVNLRRAPEVFLVDSLQHILLDQERILMTLKADRRYSVDLIDPPNADHAPIGLSAFILLIVSILGAIVLDFVVVLFLLRQRLAAFPGDAARAIEAPFPDPFLWLSRKFSRLGTSAPGGNGASRNPDGRWR